MEAISKRINELVNHFAGGNVSKFAIMVGFSEANIRNYINGTSPKPEFLSKVIEVFDINADWFIIGRGEMIMDEKTLSSRKGVNDSTNRVEYLEVKVQLQEELLKEKERFIQALQSTIDDYRSRTNQG